MTLELLSGIEILAHSSVYLSPLLYIIMLCSELPDLNAGHRSVSEIMHLYIPYIYVAAAKIDLCM